MPTPQLTHHPSPQKSTISPSSTVSHPYTPVLLPISDARTRRWVTAHALVSAEPNLSTYSCGVEEEKSVFSDDGNLESVESASSHDDEDESCIVESVSDSISEIDDDDESAIFMTRHHRLCSTNPSTTSFSRPPSPPCGHPAARRVTKELRPITPRSAALVTLDYSHARGLSSSVSSKQATQVKQHPRSSPSSLSLVAPSLTTDDLDVSTATSVSESIPIPSALSVADAIPRASLPQMTTVRTSAGGCPVPLMPPGDSASARLEAVRSGMAG